MAPAQKTPSGRVSPLFPIVTLAFWQVRQTWRLLVVSGVGMIAAAMLVCTMPLYSQVALSAGLHATLNAASTYSTINVHSTLFGVQPGAVDTMNQQIDQMMQQDIPGNAVNQNPEFVAHIGNTAILSPNLGSQFLAQLSQSSSNQDDQSLLSSISQLQLVGLGQDQLASHVHMVQGRLPRPANTGLEVALLPAVAHCLFLYAPSANQPPIKCFSVRVGDEITILSPFLQPVQDASSTSSVFINGQRVSGRYIRTAMMVRVVGLFTPINATDAFWRNNSFESETLPSGRGGNTVIVTGLTSSEALTSILHHAGSGASSSVEAGTNIDLFWYYHFENAHIDATSIDTLRAGLGHFLNDVSNNSSGRSEGVQITATGPTDVLDNFSNRMAQAQVPVAILLLLVVGMVVLFISIAIELLVERQTEAIALLRSRGASRRQVFGVFTTQMIALSLLALVIGPFFAIPITSLLVQRLFSPPDPSALTLITTQPLTTVWNVRGYALLAVGLSLLVALLTLYQTTRFDVLALRRETSRSTITPFWQRFYLDGLLAVVALGCYGYALYSIDTGVLDAATSVQVLSPLIIAAATLFLLAALLLFLRFFPRLVQLVGSMAARRNGAASMIALSQVARAPRQAIRTILLLTLTTAFAIFSLVFSASQSQRIVDIVNYQVGADFSAQLATNTNPGQRTNYSGQPSLNETTASYRAIPGVLSATLGTVTSAQVGNTSFIIKAVDANTFAHTAIWTKQDSTVSLDTLMTQLASNRVQANQTVPVIVDAATWNALHLSKGQHFALSLSTIGFNGVQIPCVAFAEVQHIPTLASVEGGGLSSQGILVDYQSFSSVVTKITQQSPSINYVWLRTNNDKNALESVRTALARHLSSTGGTTLFDRQAFITTLQHDPLTLNLVGMLTIGAFTPLILALLGSLLLSWMSARNRLLSFAVLRALGSSPAQLAGVLSWEQCIIYLLMLTLGVLCGILLSVMVLPSLILTSIAVPGAGSSAVSTQTFQGDLPMIQVVIPASLLLVLALLVIICILTLGLMARVVSRPSMSQTLRLNAD